MAGEGWRRGSDWFGGVNIGAGRAGGVLVPSLNTCPPPGEGWEAEGWNTGEKWITSRVPWSDLSVYFSSRYFREKCCQSMKIKKKWSHCRETCRVQSCWHLISQYTFFVRFHPRRLTIDIGITIKGLVHPIKDEFSQDAATQFCCKGPEMIWGWRNFTRLPISRRATGKWPNFDL